MLPLVWRLGDSLWFDEMYSALIVQRGVLWIFGTSSNANNHPMNSLLMWIFSNVGGQHPIVLRLPTFLIGMMLPQILFWGGRLNGLSRQVAGLAAVIAAVHFSFAYHAVEARGYIIAMASSAACCMLFPLVLRSAHPGVAAAYVAVAVIGIMSIATSVLVPFSHGVAAVVLLVAGWLGDWRAGRLSSRDVWGFRSGGSVGSGMAMVACLWAAVLAVMALSITIPSLLVFAKSVAPQQHPGVSVVSIGGALGEFSGLRWGMAAAAAGAISLWGIVVLRRERLVWVALVAPLMVQAVHLALPGTILSPRFVAYLVPIFALGLAAFVVAMWGAGGWKRWLGATCLAVWVLLGVPSHMQLHHYGNPDLARLARAYDGPRTLMTGGPILIQAYYFKSIRMKETASEAALNFSQEDLANTDTIIVSTLLEDLHLRTVKKPWPDDVPSSFILREELRTWHPGRNHYRVYVREPRR